MLGEGEGVTGFKGTPLVTVREGVFLAGVLGLGLGATGFTGLLFGILSFLIKLLDGLRIKLLRHPQLQ